jgi:hypothetical protein
MLQAAVSRWFNLPATDLRLKIKRVSLSLATLLAMRKCLFVLLLVILPLQFSWGAAAPYCRHPSGTGDAHFGHHQHQQKSVAADKTLDLKIKTVLAADDDCVVCHLHPTQPTLELLPKFSELVVDPPGLVDLSRFRSHVPLGLERPARWFAL